jgi:predicted transcriptional regulator
MTMRQLLMSIRPEYSSRIFTGEKRFELRRMRVRANPGDIVWVYESAPTMALVGAFAVGRVLFEQLDVIWKRYGASLGVTEREYAAYFARREFGCAIEVAAFRRFDAISLGVLRRRVEGFRPPQSYLWCGQDLARVLPKQAIRGLAQATIEKRPLLAYV